MRNYGQIAYEAYCKSTGGVSLISGESLPEWSVLNLDIQRAWAAASAAVLIANSELTMKARNSFERHVESGRQA